MSYNIGMKREHFSDLRRKNLTSPFENCEYRRAEWPELQMFADRNFQKPTNDILLNHLINQSYLSHLNQSEHNAPRINLTFEQQVAFIQSLRIEVLKWHVRSKPLVNQLEGKLHANSSPQRQLVRVLLLLVGSKSLIVKGLVQLLFARSVVTRNPPSC